MSISHKNNLINPPLFITGCMRSGTTYLFNKLSEHPQLLKIGGELLHEWTNLGGADCVVYCDHKDDRDIEETYVKNMIGLFDSQIRLAKGPYKHLERAKKVFEKQGGRIFYDWKNIIPVNKSTHLINKTKYVNGLFPKSKIIFIVRDIYGHCASLKVHLNVFHKNTGNYFYKPLGENDCWTTLGSIKDDRYGNQRKYPGEFLMLPEMWLRLNHLAIKELSELPKDQVMIINYERLVSNQKEVLSEVFSFLELEKKYKKYERQVSEKTLNYINTTTSGNPLEKWKNQLTSEEIKVIDEVILKNKEQYDSIRKVLD